MHRLTLLLILVALATAVQGLLVGFQVDFGRSPYHEVKLYAGDPVRFNRVITNEYSAYNVTSGYFTAPVGGLYAFHLHFVGVKDGTGTELGIYALGDVQALAYAGTNLADKAQGSCSLVIRLWAGNKVHVRYYYGRGALWGSPLTSFSGALVYQA